MTHKTTHQKTQRVNDTNKTAPRVPHLTGAKKVLHQHYTAKQPQKCHTWDQKEDSYLVLWAQSTTYSFAKSGLKKQEKITSMMCNQSRHNKKKNSKKS